jgi:prephenate dehydrogenase
MLGKQVGIIGLGRFGNLLRDILSRDFTVKGFDPQRRTSEPLEEVAASDTLIFCVPISGLEDALTNALPYIREDAAILDVCSVKVRPVEIMNRRLPASVRILPTHPMFGPDSWTKGTRPLPFVLCPTNRTPPADYERFRTYLETREFNIVRMTPEEHDRTMAYSLCLTQLLGRAIDSLGVRESPSDTASFRNLLDIRRMSCNDTRQLFREMQTFNPYAGEMRRRLIAVLNDIERELG